MTNKSTQAAIENLQQIKQGKDPRADKGLRKSDVPAGKSIQTQQDIRDAFVEVVNICEPEHPYAEHNPYPITHHDVLYSYCKASSNYWAKCGPRRPGKQYKHKGEYVHGAVAKFYSDKNYLTGVSGERVLTVLVHEATHITEGRHSPGSNHNPEFWRKMAKNANKVREHIGELDAFDGNIDEEKFCKKVIEDPNSSMVDRRMMSVEEQKKAIRAKLGTYHIEIEE